MNRARCVFGPILGIVLCCAPPGRAWGDEVDEKEAQTGRTQQQAATAYERNLARWRGMDDSQRETMRQVFERFKSMPPEQREELKRRYAWYLGLPQREQQVVRANFELFTSASRDELRTLEHIYVRYRRLPPEKRDKVDQFYWQWKQYPVQEQRALLVAMKEAGSFEEAGRIARQWMEEAELNAVIEGYRSMPPQRRAELLQRYRWYKQLPAAHQQLVRENLELVIAASPEEFAALKRFYTWSRRLPEPQRSEVDRFFRSWQLRSVADRLAFIREVDRTDSTEAKFRLGRAWLDRTHPAPSTQRSKPSAARPAFLPTARPESHVPSTRR